MFFFAGGGAAGSADPTMVTGSGVANQISYWTGTQTQGGSTALTYNGTGLFTFGANATTSPTFAINGAAANTKLITNQTAGVLRWSYGANATAEGGANAGSDFAFNAYSDAGALLDSPLTIARVLGGSFTVNRPASFSYGSGSYTMIVGAAANTSTFLSMNGATGSSKKLQFQTAGTARWASGATSTAESGSNAGTNYVFDAYDDAGVLIDSPVTINRAATGSIACLRPLSMTAVSVTTAAATGTVSAGGAVDDGDHLYKLTAICPGGETGSNTASATITTGGGNNTVNLTISVMAAKYCTDRALYRTKAGGSIYYFVALIGNNTSTSYVDTTADSALTLRAIPTQSFTNGVVGSFQATTLLSAGTSTATTPSLYINGSSGTTKTIRLLTTNSLRWILGSSTAAETGSNAGCNLNIDAYDDNGVLIDSPITIARVGSGVITATRSITLTQVAATATAITGVVAAGGAVDDGDHLYRITYITFAGAETTFNTASATITTGGGNNTVNLTIPVGASNKISDRALYRTKAAGAVYYFVALIGNNTATAYSDTTADASLTLRVPPASSTFAFSTCFTGNNSSLGNFQVGSAVFGTPTLSINGTTGTSKTIKFSTTNSARWVIGANTTAESGTNAGSNFVIQAYDDTNTAIDLPLTIVRAASGTIFWASGRNMGIGITPTAKLHLDSGNATASYCKFTAGTTTGTTSADGFDIGTTASGTADIRQRENLDMVLYTNNTERLRVLAAGNVTIGAISAAATSLAFTGQSAQSIGMERHSTANTAGNSLSINAGGATSAATDKAGGTMSIAPGVSTGTGIAYCTMKRYDRAASTGTADNATYEGIMVCSPKTLTNNSATGLFDIALPAGSSCGGTMSYCVECTNGTDYQTRAGAIFWAATNKAGVYVSNVASSGEQVAVSTGTLVNTWSVVTGTNKITITLNANSSLTPTVLKVWIKISNESSKAITLL